jgi:hypothetical protein
MLPRRLIALLACLVLISAVFPYAALAGSNTVAGVTLSTPATYDSCTATGDTITATNNAASPRRLTGQVIVQYVVGSNRITVPGGFYPIDTTLQPGQSLNLAVVYPPSSDWPLAQSSADPLMRELHIDVQIEVWDGTVFIDSLGYGLDWDVFCRDTPPPPAYQGCTPGYYKNHTSLTQWGGVNANLTVGSVFANAPASLASATLVQGLRFKGGSTFEGAAEILLRAGIAAYINAGHPGVAYPIAAADVVDRVNGALASGDRATVIAMASELDSFNNLGCPLGR